MGLWERTKWVKCKSNELQLSKVTAHFNHQLVVTPDMFCQPSLCCGLIFGNATKSVKNLICLPLSPIIKIVR